MQTELLTFIATQEASMKKERMSVSDEQRERMLIEEQIERAAAEAEVSGSKTDDSPPPEETGLKRNESTEKVVLSFTPKTTTASTPAASTLGFKLNPLKPAANPLKASNPLKRPNVFKQAAATSSPASTSTESEKVIGKKRDAPMTAAERLIFEEQERKRRRMEREAA